MMRVRVLYFGILGELMGVKEEMVEAPDGATVGSLVSLLGARPSKQKMDEVWARMAVAVNREYALRDVVLHEGDEVALLPPVSGGAR
jgi:molybdopterin converting factor subunit 1